MGRPTTKRDGRPSVSTAAQLRSSDESFRRGGKSLRRVRLFLCWGGRVREGGREGGTVKTPAIAVTFSRPSGATTAGSLPPRAGSVTRREADASAPEGGEGETGASRWRADLRGLRSQLARAGATASRSSTTAVTVRRERVIIRKSVLEGAAKKMSTRTIFSRCNSGRELAGGDLAPLSDHLALQRYRAGGGSG